MQSANFQIVYDVRSSLPEAWWLPIPFLVLGFAGLWLVRRLGQGAADKDRLLALSLVCVGVGGGVLALAGTLGPYVNLRVHVARGQYEILQGAVTGLTPGDPGNHIEESWTLHAASGDRAYTYSPSRLAGGFVQTVARGGPMREGVIVRVFDVGGRIARLEIAR